MILDLDSYEKRRGTYEGSHFKISCQASSLKKLLISTMVRTCSSKVSQPFLANACKTVELMGIPISTNHLRCRAPKWTWVFLGRDRAGEEQTGEQQREQRS